VVCCSCSKILPLGKIRNWSFLGQSLWGRFVGTHDSIIAQEVPPTGLTVQ